MTARNTSCWMLGALLLAGGLASSAAAFDPYLDRHSVGPFQSWRHDYADRAAARHAAHVPWNRGYYHTAWGAPVALVVPPTAHMETRWGWGVGQTTMTPIYHRYGRAYPGEFSGDGQQALPTPRWPSHTDQFGVYYVRGPWW